MTYRKCATEVAGKQYVSEITRWPGHKHTVNIPVSYPQDILYMNGHLLFTIGCCIFFGIVVSFVIVLLQNDN